MTRASLWRRSGRLLALAGVFLVGWGGSIPDELEGDLYKLLGAAVSLSGVAVYVRGKRMAARDVRAAFESNPKSSVLYLRSFRADAAASVRPLGNAIGMAAVTLGITTEEEQLAEALQELGPFVAIGKPGEKLPELGAARIYVSDDEWQKKVTDLAARAQLVVFRAGDTEGFWWEVQQAIKTIPPERIVFVLPFTKIEYATFRERAEALLQRSLPDHVAGRHMAGSKLRSILYFDHSWLPTIDKIRVPLSLSLRPLTQAFRKAFRPIVDRIPADIRQPPVAPSLMTRLATTIPAAFLVLAVVSVSGTVAESVWRGTAAARHNNRGLDLYDKNDIDGAISEYEEALRLLPDDAAAHANLGLAFDAKGDLDGAILNLRAAVEHDGTSAVVHVNYGLMLLKREQVESAIAQFRLARTLEPTLGVAHVNLCGVLADQEASRAEAQVSCETAIQLVPKEAEPHYVLGNLKRLEGKFDEAIVHYRTAIELMPSSSVAHNNLGFALAKTGHADEAIQQYREAIRLNPDDGNPHSNLADVLASRADWKGAIAELTEAQRLLPDRGYLHFNRGFALEKLGQFTEARDEYITAFKLSPDDPAISRAHRRVVEAALR